MPTSRTPIKHTTPLKTHSKPADDGGGGGGAVKESQIKINEESQPTHSRITDKPCKNSQTDRIENRRQLN